LLRLCSETEFERYADFAYELASDLTKSGYPTYCDGIKTKDMFLERARRAFACEEEQMLLFESEGRVQGFILMDWLPEDRYLSTSLFLTNTETEEALSDFLAYTRDKFKGYDLFLGFPAENQPAINYLERQGFTCIEDDYNNTAYLEHLAPAVDNREVLKIGKENYTRFRLLHSQFEENMYWNSARIYEKLENWSIFLEEKDGEPYGAVYYTVAGDAWYEIFGVDMNRREYNPQLLKNLLNAALLDAKCKGGNVMTFFCDEAYEEAAKECGFHCVGNYRCYQMHLT